MRVNDSPVQDGLDRRAAPISIPVFPRVPHHVRRGISSNTVADPVSLSYSFRAFGVRAGDHAVLDRGFLEPAPVRQVPHEPVHLDAFPCHFTRAGWGTRRAGPGHPFCMFAQVDAHAGR